MVEKLLKGHPLNRVAFQQAVDEINTGSAQVSSNLLWDLGFMALNVVQQSHMVAAIERGPTNHQLVQDGSHAPQVGLGIVLVRLENLRSHVQGGAAQGVSQLVLLQVSGKAKVSYLEDCLRRVV